MDKSQQNRRQVRRHAEGLCAGNPLKHEKADADSGDITTQPAINVRSGTPILPGTQAKAKETTKARNIPTTYGRTRTMAYAKANFISGPPARTVVYVGTFYQRSPRVPRANYSCQVHILRILA